ncbi:MAG: hypothetical protein K0Q55_1927 [Verrucomicrobia bacterium]|nr:hypothetical protein [Verrucomicrobiota bacterium]
MGLSWEIRAHGGMTRHKYHFLSSILRQILLVMGLLSPVGLIHSAGIDALSSWQWRNPLPQGYGLADVASGGGKLVAVGYHGKILVSENPTANPASWTQVDLPSHISFSGIAYHDGIFVAVGNGFWSSTNGLNWVNRKMGFVNDVIWANGVFVVVGSNGDIFTSSDGMAWTSRSSGTTHSLRTISYGKGLYVAAGGIYDSGVLLTSPDAIQWTPRTVGYEVIDSVAYGNGMFVTVGFDYGRPSPAGLFSGGNGVVRISSDGVNWTPHLLTEAVHPNCVHYHAGLFILLASEGILTSVDGQAWISRHREGWNNPLNAVVSFNGSLYAVGAGGSVFVSPDAITWQRLTGSWRNLNDVVRGGDIIVAVGDSGDIMTSEDGASWTLRYQAENFAFYRVAHGNRVFVAVGEPGYVVTEDHPFGVRAPQAIFTSTDGVTWNRWDSPVEDRLRDVTFANGIFMAVGGDQGNRAVVITSTDGKTWTAPAVSRDTDLFGVAYGTGGCAAAGYSGDIMVSADNGAAWSKHTSGTSALIRGISFANGIFVCGDYNGNLLTSTNGTNWHVRSSGTSHIFYDLAYGNGIFLAIGAAGSLVSTDGVNWESCSFLQDHSLNSVIYCEGSFIAVGSSGAILQSAYTTPPSIVRSKTDGTGFRFSITGETGLPYRIQSSSSLGADAVWTNWLDHTNGLDPKWFLDNSASSATKRFYRLVSP